MRDAFERAYKDGQWHNGSGSGSSEENTRAYRSFLADYMVSHGVRSVLDVGCGDWQFSKLMRWPHMSYTGVDVVPDIIRQNTLQYAKWAGDTMISFMIGDVLTDWLPPADLMLVKDLFQHWPDASIHEFRRRLARFKTARRILLTYDLDAGPHPSTEPPPFRDLEPGGHRPLDLTRAPFSWPVRERLRYTSLSHEGTVARTKVVMELTP